MILFTDQIEQYIPPKKGRRHVLRVVREILYFQPQRRGTNVAQALDFANSVTSRRAVLFLISDFQSSGNQDAALTVLRRAMRQTHRRHDLVAVRIQDPHEVALLPLLALWRGRRGPVAAVEYSNADIARQVARETRSRAGRWLVALPLAALALLIIGLARPQLGHRYTNIQASGVDMMLALDVSGSMQSLDFKVNGQPVSRVDIVKSVVGKFIEARPDDRIGMIEFAHSPYLVCPLTLDHDWLLQNLDRVQIGSIDDGTAIGSAIASCLNRLRDQPGKSKVVVLLTDGQNNCGKVSPIMAAEAAKALGVKAYTIGAACAAKRRCRSLTPSATNRSS